MDDEGDVVTHAERQTRALERLLLLHQVIAFAFLIGLVLLGIWLLGN